MVQRTGADWSPPLYPQALELKVKLLRLLEVSNDDVLIGFVLVQEPDVACALAEFQ